MALCKSESIPQVLSASRGTKIQSAQLGQNITCVVARACHGTRIKYHNGCFLFVYAAQGNMHMWPWSHSSSAYAPAHQNEIWAKIVIFGHLSCHFSSENVLKNDDFCSYFIMMRRLYRRFAPLWASALFWVVGNTVVVRLPHRVLCRPRAGCWLPAASFSAVVGMGGFDYEKCRKFEFDSVVKNRLSCDRVHAEKKNLTYIGRPLLERTTIYILIYIIYILYTRTIYSYHYIQYIQVY